MRSKLKGIFYSFMTVIVLGVVGFVLIRFYSYIFAQTVDGQVFEIERVTQPMMIVGSQVATSDPSILYSYTVSIKDKAGVIHTATSTDRQWAVVRKGICVEAKIFPYPFWNLDKSGTFFNARLLQQKECGPEFLHRELGPAAGDVPPATAPAASPSESQSN
jgi:hypothetical protein